MGFLDVFTGKRKIKQPAADRLFAMSTAGVTLETEMGLKSAGRAAIVFQPLGTADFDQIVSDMQEIVKSTGDETGTTLDKRDDKFGYRWMILGDPDLEDHPAIAELVVALVERDAGLVPRRLDD